MVHVAIILGHWGNLFGSSSGNYLNSIRVGNVCIYSGDILRKRRAEECDRIVFLSWFGLQVLSRIRECVSIFNTRGGHFVCFLRAIHKINPTLWSLRFHSRMSPQLRVDWMTKPAMQNLPLAQSEL